jgi:dipeptidyl aminopeptidase/acylaminoacyl peptidase
LKGNTNGQKCGLPQWVQAFLGGTPEEVPEQYEKASPITYVRKDSPAILTINGDIDKYVPLQQAEFLDAKMKQVGASHTLAIKKGVGHENFYDDPDVRDFFDRNLKVGR